MDDFVRSMFAQRHEQVLSIARERSSGNTVLRVGTTKGEYILRLCGEALRHRDREEILGEILLLQRLDAAGIPVPRPCALDGGHIVTVGRSNGILYPALPGSALARPVPKHCFAAGQVLGKIHQATAGFCFSYPRKSWGLAHATDKAKELEPYFLADDFLKRHAVPQRILALLGSMPEFSTPSGVLHEDFGVRHVLFKDDIISGVIDWDRSYEGALILDIGQAIRGWCFEGSVLSLERLQRFLAGYALERRMQLSEKDFLCRAMQFAFAERAISFALLSIQGYLDQKQRALESVEIAERLTDMQTQVINLCVSAGAR